ncbi:hypothetical protein LWE61_03360 [Sphingobium sufflavum]|uniref:hypothetical protein n=1 Tax=Sphingobium sufflavum TaxID=1129547 RepID=UPI001F307E90|nr:hypothetical protein [Sphingobium sufflavum]MCE7795591.1 hypothetical protein [Sphingobium sufflavum]
MLIWKIFRASTPALALVACACMHTDEVPDAPRIAGDTPRDVASSISRLKAGLEGKRQVAFEQAITTLALVSPDKNDARSIGNMTPQFARMVSGRSVDQIIQIADVYRASVPRDRR